MPDLPVVTVAHPIGGVDPEAVAARAAGVFDAVVHALTRDPVPSARAAARAAALLAAPDDIEAFQEFALAEGWGDGLPVLPPTAERVARLLSGRPAGEVVATLAPRRGGATLEAIAANAALAGAGPEHLPLVIAAVRAVADPRFNLDAIQATTHPCTPLVIVNGPAARRLGVSAGPNALGQGHRANAVVGRALRLTLQNVGGARPGQGDRATLGHPGKFTYCVAENEAESPWEPLHVERGLAASTSCVTVCGAEAPHNVNDHGSTSAEAMLSALAGTAATTGNNNIYLGGEPLIILGPEHARTIAASGWSKQDLKRAFFERARVRLGAFSRENLARFATIDPARFRGRSPDDTVSVAVTPDDVMVVVAGGPGKHSAIVPTFGATRAVTVPVEEPVAPARGR
ncbi:MAG TPA: hypothetical protein VFR64_16045 [Methylomirabilota bacterium]|nr:hypothetical protein [Methylomirabilota bacterium]